MGVQVRAAVVRGTLDVASLLEDWTLIRTMLPPVVLDIEAKRFAPSRWVPFEAITGIDDAILSICGDAMVEDVHRRAADLTLRYPLFRPLIDGAFRFLGRTPTALMRFAPGGIRMSLRGVNEVSYEARPHGCCLTMPNPPTEILAAPAWRRGIAGDLRGIIEMVGYEASVEQTCAPDAFVNEISWRRR